MFSLDKSLWLFLTKWEWGVAYLRRIMAKKLIVIANMCLSIRPVFPNGV